MEFHYRHNEQDYTVRLEARPDGTYLALVGDRALPVEVLHAQGGQLNLRIGGEHVHAYAAAARTPQTGIQLRYVALVDREMCTFQLEKTSGEVHTASSQRSGSGRIAAQMPGQVMQVFVSEGDRVAEGDALLLLEAMKMEIRVSAPADGVVARLLVAAGETVERGQPLVEIAPANGEETSRE